MKRVKVTHKDIKASASDAISKKRLEPTLTVKTQCALNPALAPIHLTPLPHQVIALQFLLEQFKKYSAAYLGLDPGLGKTIVAAMLSNMYPGVRIYYICPPFLLSNTDAEFSKWCFEKNLYLIPDSMLIKQSMVSALAWDLSENKGKSVLIVDEAHRFKNEKAGRTKALFKIIKENFQCVVFMSGTPMPNSRAKELWPILSNFAPWVFGTHFFNYALKYCGAHKDDSGFWNFDGFTNRAEFKARLGKSFMLRQKKDVLSLPEKIEGVLTVGEDLDPKLGAFEKEIRSFIGEEDLTESKIKSLNKLGELHLATYRRLLGEFKLKYTLPIIESILEDTDESILIFCVHKETVKKLTEALREYEPLVITGDVHKDKRQDIVDQFQTSKAHRVFIGNIQACGVGFTLTKARRVIFVESSWVDGENSQASDRAHRIGQLGTVLVQYVVLKNSFDGKLMNTLLAKRKKSI